MTVVSIRGTHGSGKSTVVQRIMKKFPTVPIIGRRNSKTAKPEGYLVTVEGLGRKLQIIGPYHTQCGGCDAVQPYDDILYMLDEAYKAGHHVLFEGALVSSSYGRVGEMMETFKDPIFAYLDTPLSVCLARIAERRLAKWKAAGKPGLPEPVDPANTTHKYESVLRSKDQLKAKGSKIRIVDIDHRVPTKQIMRLFGKQMWKEPT